MKNAINHLPVGIAKQITMNKLFLIFSTSAFFLSFKKSFDDRSVENKIKSLLNNRPSLVKLDNLFFHFNMRIISLLIAFLIFFNSCRKASTGTLNESVDTISLLKYSGNFISKGGESVTGITKIYLNNKSYQLKLENFSTSNGPDLKVYLSKSDTPTEYISLGGIKSTNGNQVYDIPGMPDFSLFKYVLIHCERHNHLYGSAALK